MPMSRLLIAPLLILAAACVPGRRAVEFPASALPFPVDSQRANGVAPGVAHRFIYSHAGPWAIHVLDVDRAACYSAVAVKGFPGAVGRKKTSVLLAELDSTGTVIGGVNADFFRPNGMPTNAHITRGRVITVPSGRPVIAFDSAGLPHILTLRRSGAVGSDSLDLLPLHPMEAVGGRPVLARDSAIVANIDSAGGAAFASTRHPRTAVGLADDGRRLLLVTVDGRQKPYSDGMTLRELANLMLSLGARDALNLDGGGSTTMVVRAPSTHALRVVNKPSDRGGERAVGNALAIVKGCPARPR